MIGICSKAAYSGWCPSSQGLFQRRVARARRYLSRQLPGVQDGGCAESIRCSKLTQLREMLVSEALVLLAIHVKLDPTYVPIKSDRSRRWHVRTARGEFEILATGSKWYDTRARIGGGGAIDLAMHVLNLSFVQAVKQLTRLEEQHGPDHS